MDTTSDTIQITKTSEEPGSVQLAIVVPSSRVAQSEDAAAKQFQKKAKLPGFRPGKAPLQVIKRRFEPQIKETVIDDLVREGWRLALEQEKLQPIAEPRASNLKFESGEPLSFDIQVDVKPDLDIARAGGFTIAKEKIPVTEDLVKEQLERIREQHAPWSPVDGERPKAGDLVKVQLATVEEGGDGTPQPFELVLGQGRALPDVEDLIMTLLPEETGEGRVTYPDDFADEAKRGTSRQIRVTLEEIKRQALPELDDEFAREVGEFDSLSALKDAIRDDLEADARREADSRVRASLMQQIIEANNVPAPKGLTDRALLMLAHAYGVTEDQWERFSTEFRPAAERQVQRDLVIDWVATKEDLHAADADVDARIAELAERRNKTAAELRAVFERERRIRDIERGITEERVFEHLLSLSTIKED